MECAKLAIEQLQAATFVIESERCFIYLPINLSEEQKKKCLELIDSANDSGEFGVFAYDQKNGKIFVSNINFINKDKTKDFITRLESSRNQDELFFDDSIVIEEKPDITDDNEER